MIGFVFFLLVMFAAITSVASLVEACTSLLQDGTGWNRRRALICVIVAVIVAGTTVTLGYGALSFVQPMGEGLTTLDFITNSVMMPIAAFLTCVFVGRITEPVSIVDGVRRSAESSGASV